MHRAGTKKGLPAPSKETLQQSMTNKRKIINDPVYGGFLTIEDDILFDVLSHRYFQRLRRIKQLGLTYLVYPGATHTRLGHMLGALNLMGRALEVLRAKGVGISREEALGARLAILLHDVGHGPFSHTSEYTLTDMPHEACSRLYMQRLDEEFDGQLSTAISIFEDSYPRHFLHQLVSSQLDMDRLDYLGRDSFFTGVSEGVVGTDRIINMLNVKDDELVVDEKGIYSIEKFIISRRLMYWQVYMHKTVIAADSLLVSVLRRARTLAAAGADLGLGGMPLLEFLTNLYTEEDFAARPELLDRFALLDDGDIDMALKCWTRHNDKVLRMLSEQLVNRHLCAVRIANRPFVQETLETLRTQTQLIYGIDAADSDYFVATGALHNHAYDYSDKEIKVLYKDGNCRPIEAASDQLDRQFLEKEVTKHFLTFPKELRQT